MTLSSNGTLQAIEQTLLASRDSLNQNIENSRFFEAIAAGARLLKNSPNRIIVTGMGKSGLIARKVAATLTSTGSPAVFLHPADALHGDMGNIRPSEVVLAFSNSGETREIIELLPHIKLLESKLIAVTQKEESTLAKEADVAIIFQITKEGCPLDLAPMASTTISISVGDALASALIHLRKFKPTDFGKFHPSGSLGKKLLTRVKDVMKKNVKSYTVSKHTPFKELLSTLVSSNMGAILVTGSKGHLRGIITDGDIKRLLDQYEKNMEPLFEKTAAELMTPEPLSIQPDILVEEAMAQMHAQKIYTICVLNKQKKPAGLVRMHDIVGYL